MTREEKITAALSYFTVVGWLFAVVMNQDRQSPLVRFHLRQALGIYILFFAVVLAMRISGKLPFIGPLILSLGAFFDLCLIVFLVLGAIWSLQGREKLVPLIGHWCQNKLKIIIP